jgi:XTP/dITP diphosphohydrolase
VKIHGPITLASRNPGKLAELAALAGAALDLRLPPPDAALPEVAEDADTYLENALAKARAVADALGAAKASAVTDALGVATARAVTDALGIATARAATDALGVATARAVTDALGVATLADDSGLEVDALDGAPGVRSARFGGVDLSDRERSLLLLERLAGVERRSARFRCVLVVYQGGEWCSAEGLLEGEITRAPRGEGGFGYDPVFAVPALGGRTVAEATAEEKNRISHRAAAMRALIAALARGFAPDGR